MPSRFGLLHFPPNLSRQRLRNVWNCEKTLIRWILFHPDITNTVDLVLKKQVELHTCTVEMLIIMLLSVVISYLSKFLYSDMWPTENINSQHCIRSEHCFLPDADRTYLLLQYFAGGKSPRHYFVQMLLFKFFICGSSTLCFPLIWPFWCLIGCKVGR